MARASIKIRPIRVMISSQCKRTFPAGGRTLTEIRQTLRDHIESVELFGQKLFTVWINEDAPAAGLEENSWDACLSQVREADILLILYAEHAGWARMPGDIGICHAELMTAHNTAPAKIRIIPLKGTEPLEDEDADRNQRFKEAVEMLNAFSPPVEKEEDLIASALNAVADGISKLVTLGVREVLQIRIFLLQRFLHGSIQSTTGSISGANWFTSRNSDRVAGGDLHDADRIADHFQGRSRLSSLRHPGVPRRTRASLLALFIAACRSS